MPRLPKVSIPVNTLFVLYGLGVHAMRFLYWRHVHIAVKDKTV